MKQLASEGEIYPMNSKVTTPLGLGTIVGLHPDGSQALVRFSHRDYQPEVWRSQFSPGNGHCVYRMLPIEFEEVPEPVQDPWIGTHWTSKGGKAYVVLDVKDDQVHILSLSTPRLHWWTTRRSLMSRYSSDS